MADSKIDKCHGSNETVFGGSQGFFPVVSEWFGLYAN